MSVSEWFVRRFTRLMGGAASERKCRRAACLEACCSGAPFACSMDPRDLAWWPCNTPHEAEAVDKAEGSQKGPNLVKSHVMKNVIKWSACAYAACVIAT